ncbi:MAG: DNA polymerase ligase N-terminal domain-containing protein [Gemmataceae bacterium]
MPRFVILEHDWPAVHWDLLLEAGGVLRAWRLLAEPGPGRTVPAEPNFDHRLAYLEYEGPLTGDRGRVKRWDAGEFEWLDNTSPPQSRGRGEEQRLVILLNGSALSGRFEIVDGQFRRATGD